MTFFKNPKTIRTMLKLSAIILPDKVFISSGSDWYGLNSFVFDGIGPKNTNKSGWYELPYLPKVVQRKKPSVKNITHYKLKDGFVATSKLPQQAASDFFTADDEDDECPNSEIRGLYDEVYEEKPESLEEIEFTIEKIAHKDSGWKFIDAPKNVQHYLLDEIAKHAAVLQDERCFLSSEESYKRIREFVKLNINPRVANVTSDYDFRLEVCKKITLHEKEKFQKNARPFSNRPKYVDDYRLDRKLIVYHIVPDERGLKSYSDSSLAPKFEGDNYEDLENNIKIYLTELIEKINEPLKDCPCCKGRGVLLSE